MRAVGNDVYIAGEQGLLLKFDRRDGCSAPSNCLQGHAVRYRRQCPVVLVHGLRGTLLRTVDGGKTWQNIDTGLQVG